MRHLHLWAPTGLNNDVRDRIVWTTIYRHLRVVMGELLEGGVAVDR